MTVIEGQFEEVKDGTTGKKGFTLKDKEKIEVLKRKLDVIKDIALDSTIIQLQDARTYQLSAGLGLYHGLKYRGSLKQGLKAGIATMVVMTGCNIVGNVLKNIDDVRKA